MEDGEVEVVMAEARAMAQSMECADCRLDLGRWRWFWLMCFVTNEMCLIRMAVDSIVIVMRHGGRFVD